MIAFVYGLMPELAARLDQVTQNGQRLAMRVGGFLLLCVVGFLMLGALASRRIASAALFLVAGILVGIVFYYPGGVADLYRDTANGII